MSGDGFFERVGTQNSGYAPKVPDVPPSAQGMPQQNFGTGFKRWGAVDGTAFYGVAETHDELPAGLYRCAMSADRGPVLVKQRVDIDALIELPDDASSIIISEFRQFWEIGEKFRERGFVHKRGYLMWGPPGSGKTSCLQILIKRLIDAMDGIVLFVDQPGVAAACLQLVRGIESARPMVLVLEDIDALVQRFGEHEYLALLDGEAQVGNVCAIATTNYPERLDRRFVDRPSRFDTIRFIDMPSAAARRVYLAAKEPSLTEDELDAWVNASDGFSVAHLKEMIIAVRCFGQPLGDVVQRLQEMRESRPNSDDAPGRPGIGFGRRIGGMQLGNGRAA